MTSHRSDGQSRDVRTIQHRLEDVIDRQEELDRRLEMVENTLQAVAEEQGLSIGGACTDCERSLLVIENGRLSCPVCDNQRRCNERYTSRLESANTARTLPPERRSRSPTANG